MTSNIALPKGSLVVVSGANGNIASHIVDKLMEHGYKVRGTVRSLDRGAWLLDYFGAKYGLENISLAEVPDMTAPGAFDDAVQGAQGFIHVATPVMSVSDPNVAIPMVVNGAINALAACAKEPGIKRVVMTSSSGAATAPKPNQEFIIDSSTWNDESVAAAWAPAPYEGMERAVAVYYAAKTESERAAWAWVREHKPGFVFNAVLPNANFGPVIDAQHQKYHSTLGWIRLLYKGFPGDEGADTKTAAPQYYINIIDDALIHVAALIYNDVCNERLFAFAHPYNWNDILALLRKLYPDQQFIEDIPDLGTDMSKVTNGRAEKLLKRISGHGWTNLEETIKQSVADYNGDGMVPHIRDG